MNMLALSKHSARLLPKTDFTKIHIGYIEDGHWLSIENDNNEVLYFRKDSTFHTSMGKGNFWLYFNQMVNAYKQVTGLDILSFSSLKVGG